MDEKLFIPRSYFVTSGRAVSKVSPLNAFDKALNEAGISQCNLVMVSSIIPKNAREIKRYDFKPGTITFTVLAKMDGKSGERIGAGIGVMKCKEYGLVAECYGFMSKEEVEVELRKRLFEMAESRGMKAGEIKIWTENMVVPREYEYGCVVVALVYV